MVDFEPHSLEDLADRLKKAANTLEHMSTGLNTHSDERKRLTGKAQGVRLALSYVEDAIRFHKED